MPGSKSTAYLAAEGFEAELEQELVRTLGPNATIEKHGRLLITAHTAVASVWAENIWFDPERIAITSIGDAAKALRQRGALWAPYAATLHRRSMLIQEKLPRRKETPLEFLGALPSRQLGSWTLLNEKTLLAASQCSSVFPNGALRFVENKQAPPSRAYLKLWELFTTQGFRPSPGEVCLDLGSSPGGWTWVLADLGCKVISVDRAPLDPTIAKMKGVEHLEKNAFALKPQELGPVDWLFSDIICYPKDLRALVETWLQSGLCRNLVCTVKFKGETDFETTERLAQIPGSRLRHLHHNKHELTWWKLSKTGPPAC